MINDLQEKLENINKINLFMEKIREIIEKDDVDMCSVVIAFTAIECALSRGRKIQKQEWIDIKSDCWDKIRLLGSTTPS